MCNAESAAAILTQTHIAAVIHNMVISNLTSSSSSSSLSSLSSLTLQVSAHVYKESAAASKRKRERIAARAARAAKRKAQEEKLSKELAADPDGFAKALDDELLPPPDPDSIPPEVPAPPETTIAPELNGQAKTVVTQHKHRKKHSAVELEAAEPSFNLDSLQNKEEQRAWNRYRGLQAMAKWLRNVDLSYPLSAPPPSLDFGKHSIFSSASLSFVIRNHSPVQTPFTLTVNTLGVPEDMQSLVFLMKRINVSGAQSQSELVEATERLHKVSIVIYATRCLDMICHIDYAYGM